MVAPAVTQTPFGAWAVLALTLALWGCQDGASGTSDASAVKSRDTPAVEPTDAHAPDDLHAPDARPPDSSPAPPDSDFANDREALPQDAPVDALSEHPSDGPAPEQPDPDSGRGDAALDAVALSRDAADIDARLDATPDRNDGADVTGIDLPPRVDEAPRLTDSGYERPPTVSLPDVTLPDANGLPFPRDDAGRPIIGGGAGVIIVYDPSRRDPVTVLGDCTALITYCYAPPARTLDACIVSVPVCRTSRPWEEPGICCPAACRDAYENLRRMGRPPDDAFDEVYFNQPDCFPGVAELLRGGDL